MQLGEQSVSTFSVVNGFERRLPLSPLARRIAAGVTLLLGAWVVTSALKNDSPRDVTLAVDLRPFHRAGATPVRVRVLLSRDGEPLRSFDTLSAGRNRVTLNASVPEGELTTHVEVDVEDRVVTRDGRVTIRAGETIEIPAPTVLSDRRLR